MSGPSFEPRILAILCNWCSYSAADAAGSARFEVPSNIRVLRVMCTGRVDPAFVLGAFSEGLDGAMVCGCHPGDCHYLSGNNKAVRRIHLLRRVLDQLGIEPERLRLEWVSASEAKRFAEVASEMVAAVRSMGPSPLRPEPLAPRSSGVSGAVQGLEA